VRTCAIAATLLVSISALPARARDLGRPPWMGATCSAAERQEDRLVRAAERLSGLDLGSVAIQYDSPLPSGLGANAYTDGERIFLAHDHADALAHELWHVVQQRQGRVHPTRTIAGAAIDDELALEVEADAMALVIEAGAALDADAPCIVRPLHPPRTRGPLVLQR